MYIDRRTPRVTPKALVVGRSIDTALKTGELPDDPVERAMMLGWRARWRDSGLVINETDVLFSHRISDEITIQGEIDAIGTDANGERVAIEWKTSSNDLSAGGEYWQRIMLIDPQVSTYLAALRELGISRLVYDVLRKPALRQSKKETADEFHVRVLEAIAAEPERYYQRATIVRLDADHDDFVRDVRGTVRLMQVGEYPRNPGSCFLYRRCEYFDVCTGRISINDDAVYMGREHPPRAEAIQAPDRTLRTAEAGQVDVRGVDAKANPYRF